MNKIITLHIAYKDLEEKLWRDIKVNENSTLDELAYLILATFDTLANHLYRFDVNGESYYCNSDELEGDEKLCDYKISDFDFQIADYFTFEYDFGMGHDFTVQVLQITEDDSIISRVPIIIHGEGRGILDDYSFDDIKDFIDEIDITGKLRNPIVYKGREWDYRDFTIKAASDELHREIDEIEKYYS